MKFKIICDGAADLPKTYTDEVGVDVVPFYVAMDGTNYLKEGVDIKISDFYQEMVEKADCYPKTSMPSVYDYIDAFLPYVKEETPVLCICLTQKFSGSIQSAMNARQLLLEKHPSAEIYVMDSKLVTALEGLFVKEAVRLRDLDLDLNTAAALLEDIRDTGHIFFTTKDLKYLEHGGRLGKVACVAGSMLNMKPVLHFLNGDLGPTSVCRGRKKSLEKVVDMFFKYLKDENIDLKEYRFGTGVGLEIPEYEEFQKMLQNRFDKEGVQPDEWIKINIGATIGVHTGPYPVGLGIIKKCNVK